MSGFLLSRRMAPAAFAGTLIAGLPAPAVAQDAQPSQVVRQFVDPDRGVSIDQLVNLALERSPVVLAARARVDVARGRHTQADLGPNPSFVTDFREQMGGSDRQTMFGVSWPLDLFARPARVASAEAAVEAAAQQAKEAERIVAASVRAKTLQVLAALRHLEVRGRIAENLSQFRALVAARAAAGTSPPLERDMADVDARRAAAEVPRQLAAVEASVAELKSLIGFAQSDPLVFRSGLEQIAQAGELPAGASPAVSFDQVLTARPDVRAAESQVRAASAALDLNKLEARSDVTLNVGYMRMASGFPVFGLNASGSLAPVEGVFHNLSIGAVITLPVRNRGQGDVAAASARVQASERELDLARLVATGEIAAARSRLQRLDEAMTVYSSGLRALATKNADVVLQSYGLGRATLLDVLTESRRLLDLESAYTDLLLETLQARSDLAAALGVIR